MTGEASTTIDSYKIISKLWIKNITQGRLTSNGFVKKKSFITFKITFDNCLPVVENNEEQLKNLYALGVFFQYLFTYQDDLENKQRTLSSLTNVFRI